MQRLQIQRSTHRKHAVPQISAFAGQLLPAGGPDYMVRGILGQRNAESERKTLVKCQAFAYVSSQQHRNNKGRRMMTAGLYITLLGTGFALGLNVASLIIRGNRA